MKSYSAYDICWLLFSVFMGKMHWNVRFNSMKFHLEIIQVIYAI